MSEDGEKKDGESKCEDNGPQGRIDLDFAHLQELFKQLASDDDFRTDLLTDPQAALKRYGIELPSDTLPADVILPPKEHFQALAGLLSQPDFDMRALLGMVGLPSIFAPTTTAAVAPAAGIFSPIFGIFSPGGFTQGFAPNAIFVGGGGIFAPFAGSAVFSPAFPAYPYPVHAQAPAIFVGGGGFAPAAIFIGGGGFAPQFAPAQPAAIFIGGGGGGFAPQFGPARSPGIFIGGGGGFAQFGPGRSPGIFIGGGGFAPQAAPAHPQAAASPPHAAPAHPSTAHAAPQQPTPQGAPQAQAYPPGAFPAGGMPPQAAYSQSPFIFVGGGGGFAPQAGYGQPTFTAPQAAPQQPIFAAPQAAAPQQPIFAAPQAAQAPPNPQAPQAAYGQSPFIFVGGGGGFAPQAGGLQGYPAPIFAATGGFAPAEPAGGQSMAPNTPLGEAPGEPPSEPGDPEGDSD